MMEGVKGNVYFIGAGPGDPGLLTVKGRSLLTQADTVIYDALAGDGVLALIPPQAKQINVGKRSGQHYKKQEEINQILIEEGKRGGIVVRLKGGDPFVFGRGGEELLALKRHHIPCEVVPGVTSALAVPAYNGIPVTHRGLSSSFHVLTGHKRTGSESGQLFDYETLAKLDGTLIFLMGVVSAEEICSGLLSAGMKKETPAAFLQEGTTASQKKVISTLECLVRDARAAGIKAPAVLMIGEVCGLAETFSWAEERPLHGVRILVTRPKARSAGMAALLREKGAEVLELPAVETVRCRNTERLDRAFDTLLEYSWLVFTSPAGVEAFFEELFERKLDIRCLCGKKIAVIGRATGQEFLRRGLIPDYMPENYYGRELARGLTERVKDGEKVLLLRAEQGSRELTELLDAAGIVFEDVPLYYTECPPAGALAERVKSLLAAGKLDFVTFTSGSTVRGFLEQLHPSKEELLHFTAVCIGTETEKAARQAGMQTAAAEIPTMDSMTECILTLVSDGVRYRQEAVR